MSMQKSFTDFLKYTSSQKEVSLAIAKDETELQQFVKSLEADNFRQAIDTSDLFKHITKPSKAFVIIKDKLSKDLYDFIIQYPTGQVEIYDKFNLKSQLVTPVYDKVSVIFIITKDALKKTQELGYQMLEHAGVSYQS